MCAYTFVALHPQLVGKTKDCPNTSSMSSYFRMEPPRKNVMKEQLGNSIDNADGAITTVLGNACLVLQVKNEVGIGGSDSFMQLVAYYVQFE